MALQTLRLVKAAFVAAVALFALLVGWNNLVDYESNFQFVRHVLSMDDTFEGNRLMSRALTAPWIHHTAYALIIAAELATAVLTAWGAWALFRARAASAAGFTAAKTVATLGLALGIGLWFTGFLTIGAEWFLMWQSETWNGQQAAFRFTLILFAVLIFLHLPETDPEA
ncbi:MAG: DUF2165 domain-containing protein [Pseudomonadota bacterium]